MLKRQKQHKGLAPLMLLSTHYKKLQKENTMANLIPENNTTDNILFDEESDTTIQPPT